MSTNMDIQCKCYQNITLFYNVRQTIFSMYPIGTASRLLGVCIKTIRRWHEKGIIQCFRTLGGHRRISQEEIDKILSRNTHPIYINSSTIQNCAIYGRVSSHEQQKKGDLNRQICAIQHYCLLQKIPVYKIYKDVGSGLNAKRKGLWTLIKDAKKEKFSSVLVNYKDRLTRFGFEYLKNYLGEFNVQIQHINELKEETSPEKELVEDLISIIQSFSGRLYGLRSSKNRKKKDNGRN
jgi:putative resolvase